MSEPCCRELSPGPWPFSRMVAYRWVDGPTCGIAECGACRRLWRFDMFAELIDPEGREDIRILQLAPLPEGMIDKAIEIMDPYEEPRWPVWVPMLPAPIREELGPRLDGLIQAGPPEHVIGCLGFARVYAVKRPPAKPVADWLEYVGAPEK